MLRKTGVMLAAVGCLTMAASALAAKVDINQADAEALQKLDGVGDARAAAIIEYRQSNGAFESVDGLTKVNGIGNATLEDNRERLTAGTVE